LLYLCVGEDGFSHVYIHALSGILQKQLTTGSYDVTKLLAVDPQTRTVFYEAADESPLRRNIYRINIDKGKPQKLSTQTGFNTATFGEQGKYYVLRQSDEHTPPVITLHDGNGRQLRVLEDNNALKAALAAARFPQREFITVPAADGITQLNGWILKPVGFNPARKYPVVMIQYSGPNSQEVQDRFEIDWYYALTEKDIVVACVDGRVPALGARSFVKTRI